MLDKYGFDLWANDYDKYVGITDDNNEYPFAGYKKLLNAIYKKVMAKSPVRVLDIGLGTGTLSLKLYEAGNEISGIDFSDEMLKICKGKMPLAKLYKYDFSNGLPNELQNQKFDFIISTYAFHHLLDSDKSQFIMSLLKILKQNGLILIGDISFQRREDLIKCKKEYGDGWDNDEYYFVYSELSQALKDKCNFSYESFSHCAGILEISPLTI